MSPTLPGQIRDAENPLSPQQIAQAQRALAKLAYAQLLIQKMHLCGIDCRGEQALADGLQERLTAVLQHFGGERINR